MSTRRKTAEAIRKYWPKWAHADNYLNMYTGKKIRRPNLYTGPFKGPDEDRMLVPLQNHKKMGRPKKKRFKKGKQTVQTVQERMPAVHNPEYAEALRFM